MTLFLSVTRLQKLNDKTQRRNGYTCENKHDCLQMVIGKSYTSFPEGKGIIIKKTLASIKIKCKSLVSDFLVFAIDYINLNFNSPTAVTLTLTFFPVPILLKGTQVYTPSDITVTLKIPELLVLLSLPLKYKSNLASGLASARHVKLRGLLRSTVVLLGTEMSFAPAGASKKKKESNHENDKGYRQLLLSVSALGVLYFTCANERVAISFIVFVNTQHEKTLMER